MIVLGIDPGLHRTGYAVTDGLRLLRAGVLETNPADPLPMRLLEVHAGILELAKDAKPAAAGVEQLVFVKNVTNGIAVAQARGAALLALAQLGVPVFEPLPMEVKMAVGLSGSAGKAQVGKAVARVFGLQKPPSPDDAADALAVARWCAAAAGRQERGQVV